MRSLTTATASPVSSIPPLKLPCLTPVASEAISDPIIRTWDFPSLHKVLQGQRFQTLRKSPADPKCVYLQHVCGGLHDHSSSCIDIVCPFGAPCHLGFLYHWVGWLSSKQWGSSTTRGEAFSNKGQRCWLESFSAAKTPQPCVNFTFPPLISVSSLWCPCFYYRKGWWWWRH